MNLNPRRLVLVASALCSISGVLFADELDGENISAALELRRAELGAPGVVALALQDGEVVAWGAAGVRALGSPDPISIHDPMHLGSCTKAMTSTLVARLIEEEVLSWSTTIAEALPDFAKDIDEGYHAVTIEQLVKHRGGIAERRRDELQALIPSLMTLEGTPAEVRLEFLKLVMKTPPLPPSPGGFDYSNYGYMAAGAIIERLTERTWGELLVENVFGPLAMKSAGIGSPTGDNVPVGHVSDGDSWQALPAGPGGRLPEALGPAGLAHSNLEDWARFVADHLAGERGEDGLLKAQTYKTLHRDVESSGYAAGWALQKYAWSWGEDTALAHNGSDGSWTSDVFALPEFDLSIVAATNCSNSVGQTIVVDARNLLLTTLGYRD